MASLYKAIQATNGNLALSGDSLTPVLNMLNTRYIIVPLQGGATAPLSNPYALGNAWFVDEVNYVDNANEEIEALHHVNPGKVAVVDKKFAAEVRQETNAGDSLRSVKLVSYEPNLLKYEVNSEKAERLCSQKSIIPAGVRISTASQPFTGEPITSCVR